MRLIPKLLLLSAMIGWTTPTMALPGTYQETISPSKKAPLFAQAKKKRAPPTKGGKGVREKYLTGEATVKGRDTTKLDFDAADIGGARKTPMGTLINQNKADKNYDFVKIRLRWHPEMVQSASSLDSGNGQ